MSIDIYPAEQLKTNYLTRLLDADDVWEEFDLAGTFIDAAIMNYDKESISIKLNFSGNDEITLAESEAVELQDVALTKIYYKTSVSGKISKVYLLAIR